MHLLVQIIEDKYLATSGGCGPRAAKQLRQFGRAEIEVPRPPLRCAAALGPNPQCADMQGAPQDSSFLSLPLYFHVILLDSP